MVQTPICFNSLVNSAIADGVLIGVAVITEGEAKGHGTYIDAETLRTVKACAQTHTDGVRVKINHGTGFDSIVGVLRNFRITGEKLVADLHLLRSHTDFERIVEIAREMPASVGLSISFSGEREKIGGKEYARCSELYSVDFVDRPAANPSGLFSVVDSPFRGMTFENFFSRFRGAVVETENTELQSAQTNLAASQKEVTELKAKVATFEADLKAANEKATKFEAELKAAQTELAAVPAKIETEASQKAQQIMASLGQPAIQSAPAVNPATPTKVELKGLAKTKAAFAAQLSKPSTL